MKFKILGADKFARSLEELFQKDLKDQQFLSKIGEFAHTRVVAETRKGNSLPDNGKLPELKPSTQNIRKYKSQKPVEDGGFKPDSRFFKPKKSNLTATGQLLNSIKFSVDEQKGQIVIEPTGDRDPSLGESDLKTNKEVARDLAARGFSFLGLDKTGGKRIFRLVLEEFTRFKRRRGFK